MDGKRLYKYILSCSKEDRIHILSSDNVRDKFLEIENHYPFVWLVQGLDEELKYFINDSYIERIINSDKGIDKFNAIMTSGNKYASDVLLNDKAIAFIIGDNGLSDYLYGLDYRIGRGIIDFDIAHNTNHFNLLGRFKPSEQLKIFNSEYIIKLLDYQMLSSNFLANLDGQTVNKLISYDKFLQIFLNLPIVAIDNLIVNKKWVIPKHLINNDTLINKYVKLKANDYRECINHLLKNNFEFYQIVEEKRNKYVDKTINNCGETLEEYNNYQEFTLEYMFMQFPYKVADELYQAKRKGQYERMYEILKKQTKKELFEMIVENFFKDIPFNFLANLKAILAYQKESNLNIYINLDLYKYIMNFNNMSIEDIKSFFNKYKDKDNATKFYDDYSGLKRISYEKINDDLFKPNQSSKLYNEELSKKYGRDVYYLDGDKFNLCIHSTRYREPLENLWMNNKKTMSLSIIGDKNINYFNSGTNDIIFGFNKLKADNIMHLSNTDSYTSHEYGTDKVQKIYSTDSLMNATKGYNEILYSEKNLVDFKPDFIVAFDFITDKQKDVANYFNLPIVLINSSKYLKKSGLESIFDNRYLDASEANKIEDYDVLDQDIVVKR